VRVLEHPDHPGVAVMRLVYGDDETELMTWNMKQHPTGPASVVRTVGDLRREARAQDRV